MYSYFESYLGFGLSQIDEINSATNNVRCQAYRANNIFWCTDDF